jgi:hypothetical protein
MKLMLPASCYNMLGYYSYKPKHELILQLHCTKTNEVIIIMSYEE